MAEKVRKLMEEMVPEFEDLVKRELCTRTEVQNLARRRERLEYSLVKRAPTREDFLRCLELEMNLESLIRVRRRKAGMSELPRGLSTGLSRSSLSDSSRGGAPRKNKKKNKCQK